MRRWRDKGYSYDEIAQLLNANGAYLPELKKQRRITVADVRDMASLDLAFEAEYGTITPELHIVAAVKDGGWVEVYKLEWLCIEGATRGRHAGGRTSPRGSQEAGTGLLAPPMRAATMATGDRMHHLAHAPSEQLPYHVIGCDKKNRNAGRTQGS